MLIEQGKNDDDLPFALRRPFPGSKRVVSSIHTTIQVVPYSVHEQTLEEAENTPPMTMLPATLYPVVRFPLRPPHMYLGFELHLHRVVSIAKRSGFQPPSEDLDFKQRVFTDDEFDQLEAEVWILNTIRQDLQMGAQRYSVFGTEDPDSCIIALASNWSRGFPSKPELQKLTKFIGEPLDLKWFLARRDWEWVWKQDHVRGVR